MPSGLLTMNNDEIDRVAIIKRIVDKQLKQREGGALLELSCRQIRRWVKEYRKHGAAGLISKKRGRVSNCYKGDPFKEQVRQLVSHHYYDFGPTFAAEKLLEMHGLKISKERLRQWMIEWKLWRAKREKVNIHQSRERRACFGELIQIDGSHHDWFEGRGPKCCLLVFIDDATSQLVGLRFEKSETTAGYFRLTREYIEHYGQPVTVYSDRDSIFRINCPGMLKGEETQFGRAMRELGIKSICANSPQAKGRVERANKTLQKRLVRELRLRNINDMDSANAFLATFIEDFNRRFAKEARDSINKHRGYLPLKGMLDLIFSFQETRVITKNLEMSYGEHIYQIQAAGKERRLQRTKITVCEDLNGQVILLHEEKQLEYTTIKKEKQTAKIVPLKQLDEVINRRGGATTTPAANHPWRRDKQIKVTFHGSAE